MHPAKLELIHIPISELKPCAKNPRERPERQIEMLARSISRYGFNPRFLSRPTRQ